MQTDMNRETDSRVTSALHDNALCCLSSTSLFIFACPVSHESNFAS